jgi:hypothetical protein
MRHTVASLAFALAACGGSTGGLSNDAGGNSLTDGSSGGSDAGSVGDVVQPSDCASASQSASCVNEGEVCWIGACPDPCAACTYLKCQSGAWTYGSAAATQNCGPDGSIGCGDMGCDPTTQYCEQSMIAGGTPNTYACKTLPTSCAPAPTCNCIPEAVECNCQPVQGSFFVTCPPL